MVCLNCDKAQVLHLPAQVEHLMAQMQTFEKANYSCWKPVPEIASATSIGGRLQ